MGDDVEKKHAKASALASAGSLVGDDSDGVAFSNWYGRNFNTLLLSMHEMAQINFSTAVAVHDFEKMWDLLEKNIISTLPGMATTLDTPIP